MSIDRRIKEGLAMIDEHLDQQDSGRSTDLAYRDIRRRGRRTRASHLVVGLVAAAAVVALAMVWLAPFGSDEPSPAAGPSPAASASLAPTDAAPPDSPVEQSWQSAPVSFVQLARGLREAGQDRWVPALRAQVGDFGRGRVGLTLRDGVATTTVRAAVGPVVVDRADYALSTGRIGLTPHAGDRPTASLEVMLGEGPRLVVVSVESDDPSTQAVLSALYTSAPFTAVG
jgi:hypothetical protein